MFVDGNPFFHLLNIVRQPLLGELPALQLMDLCLLILTFLGLLLAGLCFVRFRSRIPYWV